MLNVSKAFLIALFLGSFAANAEVSIELKDGGFFYNAQISENGARIQGHLLDLSLSSKDCNKRTLKRLESEIKKASRTKVLLQDKSKALNVKLNGKAYALKRDSRLAKVLSGLAQTFKRAKQREQVLCK